MNAVQKALIVVVMMLIAGGIAYTQQVISGTVSANMRDGSGTGTVAKAGNTAGAADVALVVADPNVLGALQAATPAGDNTIGRFAPAIPSGATQLTASATGTTTATAATLSSGVGVTAYICGFSIRANATAAATGDSTVAGATNTLHYTQWTAPLASGIGLTEQIFMPCLAASATNTNIVVTSAAPGTGGTVSVAAWGYSK